MATLEIQGFEDLESAFKRISDIPWEVTEEALGQMATVAAGKIKATGESMGVRDPESNVHILDKIKLAKAKKTMTGGELAITFSGTRTRRKIETRNAEIAFVNEYGKRGQKARPFVGIAMSENEDKIMAAAETVIGEWIEQNFK